MTVPPPPHLTQRYVRGVIESASASPGTDAAGQLGFPGLCGFRV